MDPWWSWMDLGPLLKENEHVSQLENVLPDGWPRPSGYSNGVLAPAGSRALHVAGQIAWDTERALVGEGDFAAQFAQALENVIAIVRTAGGECDGGASAAREYCVDVATSRERCQRRPKAGAEHERGAMAHQAPGSALEEGRLWIL